MRVRIKTWLPAAVGVVGLWSLASAAGSAQCNIGCNPSPPACGSACQPPPPPPPPTDCCTPPGPPGHPPTTNVNVNVNVNASANASASARANAGARAGVYGNIRGGGGGGGAYFSVEQPYPTVIQGLNVEAGSVARVIRVPFEARRRWEKRVVIQAFCIDDRAIPHAASQVFGGRDVADSFEGELYRCIAGTRLQVTWSEWTGQVSFDQGETFNCEKGQALWRDRSGEISCKVERRERDCNERSLLRRYGAGIKVVTWVREEIYTEYREEIVQEAGESIVGATLMLDGGVGGRVF